MRPLPLVFLTLMVSAPSLLASAGYTHFDEEVHASRQHIANLVEGIETLEIEKIDPTVTQNDHYLHLAGEFRSMKTAVVKMLNRANLSADRKYTGGNDEPIRRSVRVMIRESSLNEADKTEHMRTWSSSVYTMKQLMEQLNVYSNGELQYISLVKATPEMPKDDCEREIYLHRQYLAYADLFIERCTLMAKSNVFASVRKSPRIPVSDEIQSPYDSDKNISSSRDVAPSQNPSKYNYSEDYIRMNFREGERIE
jgi:hypothetical protein